MATTAATAADADADTPVKRAEKGVVSHIVIESRANDCELRQF